MGKVIKSISFNTELDSDVLEKLNEVRNISEYIKNLIRNDISNNANIISNNAAGGFTDAQRFEIVELVKSCFNGLNIQQSQLQEVEHIKTFNADPEEIENSSEVDKDILEALEQFDI